jgi:hypothetical protein
VTDLPPPPPDPDDEIAGDIAGYDPNNRYGPSDPLGAHIVNWRTLPDHKAPTAWNALRAWVEWFTVRYRISESVVPPCWYKHGQLVEELSALHTAHDVAFDTTDSGYGPIGWHERLSLALPRLNKAYSGGCARGHDTRAPRPCEGITDEQEWDAWTRQAHARRDTTPGVSDRKEKE